MLNAPNLVTLLRIALVPALAACAVRAAENPPLRRVALGLLLASLASDALDGWLARRRGQVTPLGALLDPLADKLLFSTLFLCLALPLWPGRLLPPWVAVIIVSRDACLSLGALGIALATGALRVRPSPLGKASTAALGALGVSALAGFPRGATETLTWIAVALAGITWVHYTVEGMRQLAAGTGEEAGERSPAGSPG